MSLGHWKLSPSISVQICRPLLTIYFPNHRQQTNTQRQALYFINVDWHKNIFTQNNKLIEVPVRWCKQFLDRKLRPKSTHSIKNTRCLTPSRNNVATFSTGLHYFEVQWCCCHTWSKCTSNILQKPYVPPATFWIIEKVENT